MNFEETSWRRFEKSKSVHDDPSGLLNTRTPGIKNWFSRTPERITSIHVSPDGKFYLAKTNNHRLLIISTVNKKILQEIDFKTLTTHPESYRIEVIGTFNQHFILASESSLHQFQYDKHHVRGFFPNQIYLLNYNGELVAKHYIENRLKSVIASESGTFWAVATQDNIEFFNLKSNNPKQPIHWAPMDIPPKHIISAMTISAEQNRLYVAVSPVKSKNAASLIYTYSLDPNTYFTMTLQQTEQIPYSTVYKIKEHNGSLFVDVPSQDGSLIQDIEIK